MSLHKIIPYFPTESNTENGSQDSQFSAQKSNYSSSRPNSKLWGPVLAHSISKQGKIVAQYSSQNDVIYQRPALEYKSRHLNKCYDAVCYSEDNTRNLL